MSGDVAWGRLSLRKPSANGTNGAAAAASSTTLISLARRQDLPWLMGGMRNGDKPHWPDAGAGHDILELLRSQGALFYDDIVAGSRRLPTDVERGLWELVAGSLITADGFQALRSLMRAGKSRSPRRSPPSRFGKTLTVGMPSGRWALLPAPPDGAFAVEELANAWADQLLFRYGVVFRDVVQREELSVPWREILRSFRKQEARGLIRGGRFVSGFYGEQYARPEAVESLRAVRKQERNNETARVSAVDPLNLAGILTPGSRITSLHTKGVAFVDGLPQESLTRVG